MRPLISIFFIFILGTICLSFGQEYRYNYSTKNVKELKKFDDVNAGKIHIKTKINEDGDIFMFLINRTDSLLRPFLGHSSHITFKKEAIDKDGQWQVIDHSKKPRGYWVCGMGLAHLKLEANHYTWATFNKSQYAGDYATSIRFTYRFNDSLIVVSKPIKAVIKYDLFLPLHERQLLKIDSVLGIDTLSQKKRYRMLEVKSRIYNSYESIEKTIEISNEMVNTNPEWLTGKPLLARSLLRYLGKNRKHLSEAEISLLLSKTIALWEQTPTENKKIYERSQEYLKKYDNYLLSKDQWLSQNEIPLGRVGDDYYARLAVLDGELVKIKFGLKD